MEERHASFMGMWAFLATEMLFFGALFTAYAVYRIHYGEAFTQTSKVLSVFWGAANTAILLVSSLTVAHAVRASRLKRKAECGLWLGTSALLGLLFLGIKIMEWATDAREGHLPWGSLGFNPPGLHPEAERIFLNLYFIMTGIHGLHLFIGIGLLVSLAVRMRRNRLSDAPELPVEIAGLYWHFVDIVWIFLYPLFYLAGR